MITTFILTCSDYVFAISSDVGIQMKLILRKIMKNEINDTLKVSDDSKDQTKETNNVEQLADYPIKRKPFYRLALQMRMKHVKNLRT